MLQKNLWNGGHQANRADKYLNLIYPRAKEEEFEFFLLVTGPPINNSGKYWNLKSKDKTINLLLTKRSRNVIKYISDLEEILKKDR